MGIFGEAGELIRSALSERIPLGEAMIKAGRDASTDAAKLSTGELDMPGVTDLIRKYQLLYQLYSQFGQLSISDGEKMKIIAREFDRLDSSAG